MTALVTANRRVAYVNVRSGATGSGRSNGDTAGVAPPPGPGAGRESDPLTSAERVSSADCVPSLQPPRTKTPRITKAGTSRRRPNDGDTAARPCLRDPRRL